MKKKNLCEVCDSKDLVNVLDLGKQPLCDDLIEIGNNKKSKKYKILIQLCKNCLTAKQRYNVNNRTLFPKIYHYRSRLTNDVLTSMNDLVFKTKKIIGNLYKKNILDIGCNDGSLLNYFKKAGANTLGIEPTDACLDVKKKIKIINDYFNYKSVREIKRIFNKIDVITFTNVFAHINNLEELLNNLKKIINPSTVLIIENHYLLSILDNFQFDTFYHEHPRTYSLKSFIFIAKKLNMSIIKVEFPKRYGGNIRVFLKKDSFNNNKIKKFLLNEKNFIKKFKKLNSILKKWKKNKLILFKKYNTRYNSLPGKAFPGRASILINHLGLNEKNIAFISEQKNSPKIGHYVPGTRIPIVSDEDTLLKKNYPIIINFAWHIKEEIRNYLFKNKVKSKIINIIDKNDFKNTPKKKLG
jgi:SAM-dependent methyltransferase